MLSLVHAKNNVRWRAPISWILSRTCIKNETWSNMTKSSWRQKCYSNNLKCHNSRIITGRLTALQNSLRTRACTRGAKPTPPIAWRGSPLEPLVGKQPLGKHASCCHVRFLFQGQAGMSLTWDVRISRSVWRSKLITEIQRRCKECNESHSLAIR